MAVCVVVCRVGEGGGCNVIPSYRPFNTHCVIEILIVLHNYNNLMHKIIFTLLKFYCLGQHQQLQPCSTQTPLT